MATLHLIIIDGIPWHVARLGEVDVLRNRTRTGIILDCWSLGLTVEG